MELNLKFTEIQDVFPDTEGARRVSAMDGANQIFEQFLHTAARLDLLHF